HHRGGLHVLDGPAHNARQVGGGEVVHADCGGDVGHAFAHVAVTAAATVVRQGRAVGSESDVEGVAVADIQQRGLGLINAGVRNALAYKRAIDLCHGQAPLVSFAS